MRQRDDEQDGDLESPVTSRPVLHISLSFNHTRPGEGSDVESPFERCLLMSSGGVAISMAHAHGPLSRTNTAPVFSTDNNSRNGSHSAAFHQTMSHVSRSSQLSGSTAYTNSSSTSLSSMTSSATLVPASNSGPVQATNNIINQRADASRSLYQICVNLRQRLALVPDFEAHFHESDEDGGDSSDNDPVESLWKCLKRGTPLTTIYNAIQPAEPLRVDDKMPPGPKKAKLAAFKFVEACMKDLGLAPGDCFALTDLFGTDTTGFVKVTQIINIVLDIAEERGLLLTAQPTDAPAAAMPGSKMTYRDHVVRELVDTERKYVQDLENLHELKRKIEQKSVIPGDIVHDIFLNINAILDFQRRFLIRIETTNSQPDEDQKWGLPFTFFEEAFDIYQPFIANQRRAAALAKKEFDKISQADHPVVIDFNTLDGFLLKPMQRLVKYPMLLKDLRDKTGASDEAKADLTAGIEAASRVLADANAAVDKELRAEALADLIARVDDWKNHVVDNFGELLLYGHFPVVTGKSDVQKEVGPRSFSSELFKSTRTKAIRSSTRKAPHITPPHLQLKDALNESVAKHTSIELCQCLDECQLDAVSDMDQFLRRKIFMEWQGWHYTEDKPLNIVSQANEMGVIRPQFEQYTIYLFERILLCCKELNPNKSKDKLMGVQKDKKDKKDKKTKGPDKNAKLQLKGRIFMTNVSEVLSLGKPGSWTVQIFWKGEPTPAVENFIIRFSNEESMKKWYAGVDGQRKAHAAPSQSAGSQDAAPSNFAWMRDQAAQMPNPYVQQDDDDDDDDYQERKGSVYSQHSNGFPRNASTSSLRSRSTTGESSQSLAGMVRAAPSRFPMGMGVPPLSLQTQISNPVASPSQRGGESYFSPAAESPTSSRTSANSSMFPFPRQGTPQGGWEDSNRYTAPAVARAPSRDSSLPANAHQNNRGPQRPSLPAIISQNVPGTGPPRSRSYSTPDINIQPNRRPGPPSGPVPAVPGIPAHLHGAYDAGIPRSANNSPNNGVPLRTSTQSPGSQRERPGQYTRVNTSQTQSDVRSRSPPPQSAISTDSDVTLPTQLKVKVNCDGNYVTLVVAFNITYQSLIDRIDAKVGRFSNNAIARGTMRLRYRDEDGDFVTIESDDDIQIAFQEWRESQKLQYHTGQLGEIELFCLSIENS